MHNRMAMAMEDLSKRKSALAPQLRPPSNEKVNKMSFRPHRPRHRHSRVRRNLLSGRLALSWLLISMTFESWQLVRSEITCPSYAQLPYCSCLVVDDQLHVQCSGNDIPTLQKSLQVLNGPVKSFSVYDLDSRTPVLPNGFADNVTSPVFHIQLSHSSLEGLGETSLSGLSKSLESLAVISARLKHIPQSTLSALSRVKILDFEGNHIETLGPNSFNKILLQKINLKRNQLQNVSEQAFSGLEETLMEIDMSENKLKLFPYKALKKLRHLSSLNLAWNEMSDLLVLTTASSGGSTTGVGKAKFQAPAPSTKEMEWPLLKYLNLNSNYFRKLEKDTFVSMSNLRSLSIHLNSIEFVDEDAFSSLLFLESIDLSHNKIVNLHWKTFQRTPNVASIDLSNNHLHDVNDGLFNNLSELRELLLNGNNILELTMHTFTGSPSIQVIYLQQNALRFIESGVFSGVRNLSEIRLSENFLRILPQDIFRYNSRLTSISLDGNLLAKVVPGTFASCKELRELRLQNNQITTIPSGVLEKLGLLEEVHLENNRLSLIQGLGSLVSLRYVSLSRNHIERVTASLLPTVDLNSLSLGNNFIHMIEDGAFSNQSSLSVLFLANNKLSHLGARVFHGLRNLARLHLQKNNISWIHEDTFNGHTKALQYIDLSYNVLKSVPKNVFINLLHVEEINLAHNEIRSLEEGIFTHLQTLRIIDLSYNQLTSIDYTTHFPINALQILKICCNHITEFHVQYIAPGPVQLRLKELDLHDNQLTAAVLRHIEMPHLTLLQVSGNNLSDVDESTFVGFQSLSFLSAERCSIITLPGDLFRHHIQLAVIRLSENGLTWIPDNIFIPSSLPLPPGGRYERKSSSSGGGGGIDINSKPAPVLASSSPPRLRELHLKHNKLRSFPYKSLGNATSLEVLTLGGNRITSLDVNRVRLPRLKQFDMNSNGLTKLTGPGLAKSMPNLEVVDFGENNLTRLPDDFLNNVSLTQANFGGNSLQKIPFAVSSMFIKTPHVLNMSGNPLVNFYTENHPAITFNVMDLYLSDTNVTFLTSEEFKIYPKLHRLVIKRNPLNLLPSSAFSALASLNLLDLSENDIENLKSDVFIGLQQLKSLNVSHNRIKNLSTFHPHLANLQDLDLSYNQISRLQSDVFSSLSSLVFLRLRGNWLTNIPGELFGSLVRLSVLDLSHNFIENVPSKVQRHLETRISTFRLEENPLSCDCESRDFWEWLQSHPKILSASSLGEPNFVCERPEELKGRRLMETDLPALCLSPAILKLAIQDVRPSSAVVSWQGRNNSGMQGYVVAYHALNHNDIVKTRPLPASSRVYMLPDLQSDTPYLVCVLGLSYEDSNGNMTTLALTSARSADLLLKDSPYSKCAQVRTLGLEEDESVSVFQRRLGVLVGALVGLIVFTILITTLACVKIRARRLLRAQTANGKVIDYGIGEALTTTTNVGTLGTFHHPQSPLGGGLHNHNTYLHHHQEHEHDQQHHDTQPHHFRTNGNGIGGGGGGGGGTPRNASPAFLSTYRHYSLATTDCSDPSQTMSTELERL